MHNSVVQKTGENAGGAAPITFHAQKTTFRAVLRTKRREGAIVDTERQKSSGGRPPDPEGETPTGYPSARGRTIRAEHEMKEDT